MLDTRPSPSHPRSVSHPVSPFILVHLSICYMALPLLASGLPQFCELCCPCGLHCVISGLLAGGSPGFRAVLCWFPISQSSCMAAFVIVCRFCLVLFDRHSNPEDDTMDDTMLSPFFKLPTSWTDQLITQPSLFVCCVLLVCLVLGCFALVFFPVLVLLLFVFFLLASWQQQDFVLVLPQFTFEVRHREDGWRCLH